MLLRSLALLSIIISTVHIAAAQQPFPPQLLGSVKLLKDVLTLQSPREARWHPGWGWLSAPQDQATKESALQWVIPGWGWLGGWAAPQEKSLPWNGFSSGVYEQSNHGKKSEDKESAIPWWAAPGDLGQLWEQEQQKGKSGRASSLSGVVPGVDLRGSTDEKAIPWWAAPGDLGQLWEQQKGRSVQQEDASSECPSRCLPCWFPASLLNENMVACNNREACKEMRQQCSDRRHLTAANLESSIGQQLSALAALYLDTTTAIAKSGDSDQTKTALTEAVEQIYDSIVSNLDEQTAEQSSPGFLRPSQRSIDHPINFIAPCWWPAERLTQQQAKCRSVGSCAHAKCEPTKDPKYIRLADMYTSTLEAIAGSNAQTPEQRNGLANAVDYIFDSVVAAEAKQAAKGNIQEAAMCWPDWFPDWMLNKEEQQLRRRPPCVASRSMASAVRKDSEMGEVLTSIGELYRKIRSLITDPLAVTTIPGDIRGQIKMSIDGVFDKAVRDTKRRQEAQQV